MITLLVLNSMVTVATTDMGSAITELVAGIIDGLYTLFIDNLLLGLLQLIIDSLNSAISANPYGIASTFMGVLIVLMVGIAIALNRWDR